MAVISNRSVRADQATQSDDTAWMISYALQATSHIPVECACMRSRTYSMEIQSAARSDFHIPTPIRHKRRREETASATACRPTVGSWISVSPPLSYPTPAYRLEGRGRVGLHGCLVGWRYDGISSLVPRVQDRGWNFSAILPPTHWVRYRHLHASRSLLRFKVLWVPLIGCASSVPPNRNTRTPPS